MEKIPQEPDFIVSNLLSELKSENARKSKLIHGLIKVVCGCVFSIIVVIASFLWYLYQYDFTSTCTSTTSASGVYALVDSEGNVLAQDFTAEELQEIMKVINGESNSAED